ncbi:vanadium-dependent haloperoxidase [Actinomadura sp. NEAU-AAG7]|uniref:vanadium-dependent haloperoxidase n=1 Tax=Actinomadura sp. NEAU-AAG7 TaxID=2839640 RepID=UPI001BE4D2C1|nr:vanadium-dependent haloperoxidase [Actinomadura sp. NEAU-AAG7]MBT2212752.1 vanadium-dependent haloperoxidase [Actinomadura sp. NEAU-AAG7]
MSPTGRAGPAARPRRPHRTGTAALAVTTTLGLALGLAEAPARAAGPGDRPRGGRENVVLRWSQAQLEATTRTHLGPPMVARALAVTHTCMYDAWAAYDRRAAGTRFGTRLRRPRAERTARNKDQAISYAAYTAAVDLWPTERPRFDALMAALGYPVSPAGRAGEIGVRACEAVLRSRHDDGANQLGDLQPGAYSDYTGYRPVNDPLMVGRPMDKRTLRDPGRWQALALMDDAGVPRTQEYMGPHMGYVQPFALRSWDQFKIPAPARYGSRAYTRQARDIMRTTAHLTDRQKVISEYWADEGPGFVSPPGTWANIARFVSLRDRNGVDDDVKMFFAMTNAVFDSSIAVWGYKRHHDSVRPISAIRYLYGGKRIPSWPEHGRRHQKVIDGGTWWPYQPPFFVTPAFAEYPSGHSAFGAAGGQVLKMFTGSDRYGDSVTVRAGSSRVEPGRSPRRNVTLRWPTFSSAIEENGVSREYGGIHFKDAVEYGTSMGRKIGVQAYNEARLLFAGFARPAADETGS